MSFSKKNVIRGLHLQTKKSQGKFISVIKGSIFDVVVDLRKNSKTYGKYLSTVISEKIQNQFMCHLVLLMVFVHYQKKIM